MREEKKRELTLYKRPDNYIGTTWEGYYDVLGQSRESDCLERSNWKMGLAMFTQHKEHAENCPNKQNGYNTVEIAHCSHWAVGWVEELMVCSCDIENVKIAQEIETRLYNYPVLDEDDFSSLETEEIDEIWNKCYDLREKINLCAKYDISIFSARSKYCPVNKNGESIVSLY